MSRALIAVLSALTFTTATWAQPVRSTDFPLLDALGVIPPAIDGPVDDRFFGTFCQTGKKKFCKEVRWAPDPCADVESMAIHLDHVLTRNGSQLLGSGAFRLDGKRALVTVAGAVTAPRTARFAANVPGLGRERGEAWITHDGVKLTVTALGRALELRKDACGNDPPEVSLNLVGGPEFSFRETVSMGVSIVDEDDDRSFPADRIQLSSDRQGPLLGHRANFNRFLSTNRLVPGRHQITARVVDSNGLIGTDTVDLTVVNRPPVAQIDQPDEGETVPATVPIFLRGFARDPEEGVLLGNRLRWQVERSPGDGFFPVGVGQRATATFLEPGGSVRVRLTATDSAGERHTVERRLTVEPYTGNSAPQVTIEQPQRLLPGDGPAITLIAGDSVVWEASVFDFEDAVEDLELRWEVVRLDANGDPDPSPLQPNPAPVTGELAIETVIRNFGTHRATFTARDPDGAESSRSIEIFVFSEPEP